MLLEALIGHAWFSCSRVRTRQAATGVGHDDAQGSGGRHARSGANHRRVFKTPFDFQQPMFFAGAAHVVMRGCGEMIAGARRSERRPRPNKVFYNATSIPAHDET
ncbi:MAG: hypothetical protein IPH07_37795 [Deltaproteobacteria bacterium]|nr:hypothetical protein [Deltaproteobacteria bacterium]MBK8235950.1 hypothetical protein [Deltaproteobacteria bacterium]MBK8713582.1 hypothetical protein [Deltaproteobacteria bacterium]MBP7289714.1 hypothetical protein [Nannocystaceae bacterium]